MVNLRFEAFPLYPVIGSLALGNTWNGLSHIIRPTVNVKKHHGTSNACISSNLRGMVLLPKLVKRWTYFTLILICTPSVRIMTFDFFSVKI